MIEIIPAIMPKNYDDLVGKVGLFAGVAPLVQLDIMDGKFVPNRTWPYNPGDQHFVKIIKEEEGMPEWEIIDFEVDLMIQNPEEVVGQWVLAGAERIIVHIEGVNDFEKIRKAVPQGAVKFGLALNPSTPLSSIEPYLDRIDFVQCMGIAKIGFQGESFDSRVLEQIRSVRNIRPDMPISVDGSVNSETAGILVKAGATRLVAGSAILKSGDVSLAVLELRNLVQ
ncbi:MAG: hypothetical protein HY228_01620 [Candidatus Yonathbacteria bacterium]|nr:hypothetical protein [Candidatus Yonathbacteria bacterium]